MRNEKENVSKSEAAELLQSVESAKCNATALFRMPITLIILISLSGALTVFSWGMTEHENIWMLGMYVGWISFAIFTALGYYTHHLLGVKVNIFINTKNKVKSTLVSAVLFLFIYVGGRELRLLGFEFAPHIAGLMAGVLLGYLLYKYPTGEYFTEKTLND